jgi:hypothetical protein
LESHSQLVKDELALVGVKAAREAKIYALEAVSYAEEERPRLEKAYLQAMKEEAKQAEERLEMAEERAHAAEERKLAANARQILEDTHTISEDAKRLLEKEQAGAEAPRQSYQHTILLLTFHVREIISTYTPMALAPRFSTGVGGRTGHTG